MKHTIADLVGRKVAVNCRTESEANSFLNMCHEAGHKWNDRSSLLANNDWSYLYDKTCYEIENYGGLTYASIKSFECMGYTIIPFGDILGESENVETLEPLPLKGSGKLINCPSCNAHNDSIRKVCRFCNAILSQSKPVPENDAVEFGQWLWDNTYEQRWKDGVRRFLNKDAKSYTTSQLYDIFKSNKTT